MTTHYAGPDVPDDCPQVVRVWGPFWVKYAWDVNGGGNFLGTLVNAPVNVQQNVLREADNAERVSA